ncbi:hypothetical protein UA38_22000 [Photobacterium kishitanii]|uniref:Uncharacterized protein n=1 Tax=Photobacterium kishitanii TaxID=318456 RepID=A0AAX0YSE6_9GAMM|nr:hypothetical protein UA38_22000 [Photobacterium kishitanii]KJG56565.1 hypothetical protein UA42_22360 [Photobacterium kishitanii]KJG63372.1 hypothetical protein UA40_22350 [Photobacterium kishitanii]KJG65336.1 hypothetical protein UA41_22240 [Photobacterium kishitanii]PSX15190.1 hypothetical protein C0W70_22970 [Photobacterium kishitanii]
MAWWPSTYLKAAITGGFLMQYLEVAVIYCFYFFVVKILGKSIPQLTIKAYKMIKGALLFIFSLLLY